MPDPTATDHVLDAYLEPRREERLERLKEFLRIPSISALPAACARTSAAPPSGSRTSCVAAGIEHVEVSETGGHPMVYGDWLHAEGAPTVLVYGHYDVQPVDPLTNGAPSPSSPVVDGHRLIGRGSADDKGQIHAHVVAAAALLATRDGLPINVTTSSRAKKKARAPTSTLGSRRTATDSTGDAAMITDTGFSRGQHPGDHDLAPGHDVRPDRCAPHRP